MNDGFMRADGYIDIDVTRNVTLLDVEVDYNEDGLQLTGDPPDTSMAYLNVSAGGSISLGGLIDANGTLNHENFVSLVAVTDIENTRSDTDSNFMDVYSTVLNADTGIGNIKSIRLDSVEVAATNTTSGDIVLINEISSPGIYSTDQVITQLTDHEANVHTGITNNTAGGTISYTTTQNLNIDQSITSDGIINIAADTLGVNAALTSVGTTTLTGSTGINLGASITTTDSAILLDGDVTRSTVDAVVLDTGLGAGDVTITGTLESDADTRNLEVIAGLGNVDFQDDILDGATDLNNLTITSAVNVNFDDVYLLGNLTQTASGTGTTTFEQMVSVGGLIDIDTVTIDINAALTSAGTTTLTGSAGINLGAGINTTNSSIILDGLVIRDAIDAVALDTGTGAGDITLTGTLATDADTRNLEVIAGLGNIDFQDDILDGATDLNNLTITSAANVNFDDVYLLGNLTQAASGTGTTTIEQMINVGGFIDIDTDTIDVNVALTSVGTTTLTGTTAINLGAGINTTDSTILLEGDVTRDTVDALALDTGSGAGNVTITGTLSTDADTRGIEIIAGLGNVNFQGDILDGATDLGSLIITSAADVQFDNAVNVAGIIDINTTTMTLDDVMNTINDGTITITNTGLASINADITSEGSVHFNSTGEISMGADVETTDAGSVVQVDNSVLTITGDRTLTANNGNIILDEVSTDTPGSNTLELIAGTGNITIDDNIGTNFNKLAGLTISGANNVSFTDMAATIDTTDLTISNVSDLQINGAVNIGGDVDIQTTDMQLNAALITTSDTANGDVTIDNAGLLNINSNMLLSGLFIQDSSADTGQTSISGNIITVNNNITFDEALTLTGDVRLDIGSGFLSQILFNNTVDDSTGIYKLTLDAGNSGSISFQDAVGSLTPLNALEIVSASQIDVVSTLSAGAGNIAMTGGIVNLNNAVSTIADGTLTITNSSVLTIANTADLNLEGAFLQDGNGPVNLSGNITTTGDDITLERIVTLNDSVAVSTGGSGGNILFSNNVSGLSSYNQDFTLTAGTGSIRFDGMVGDSTTSLGDLDIVSAAGGVTAESTIDVAFLSINNGGIVSLNNTVSARDGLSSAGTFFTNSSNISTTNSNITINHNQDVAIDGALNSGTGIIDIDAGDELTILANIITNNGNVFIDSDGPATIESNGDITTNGGNVAFGEDKNGDLLISGDVETGGGSATFNVDTTLGRDLNIETANGNIAFNEKLDAENVADQGLYINPGTGNVHFYGPVGQTRMLGDLQIDGSDGGVDADSQFKANSITINDGGSVTLNSAVVTQGTFRSSGTDFNMADGALIDSGSSTIDITADGNVTLGGLKTTSSSSLAVKIESGGDVIDGGQSHLEIDAANGTLDIKADGGIGENDQLEIKVASLNAHSRVAGDIGIVETDGNVLNFVHTTDGDIYVKAGEDIEATDILAGGNGTVTLISGGGDITLDTVKAGDLGDSTVSLSAVNGNIDGGIFEGSSADLYAITIGLTEKPTANVSTLTIATSGESGGYSGKLGSGTNLTTRPPEDDITGPGKIYIDGFPLFNLDENATKDVGNISGAQENVQQMLSDASSSDFYSEPPLLVSIDIADPGTEEDYEDEEEEDDDLDLDADDEEDDLDADEECEKDEDGKCIDE